ncbi:MAG TPA: hypothetical protein VES94_06200 [Burkholderiales bacterium]|nr:hypothetical protein [Burkholderiales bacterium]
MRRENLRKIVSHFKTMAAVNRKLGRDVRDATLGQILIGSPNSKTGKPRQMGDKLARSIEEVFGWDRGRLDAPLQEPLFAVVQQPAAAYQTGVMIVVDRVEQEIILALRKARGSTQTESGTTEEKLHELMQKASQKNPPPVPAPPLPENVSSLRKERNIRLSRGPRTVPTVLTSKKRTP